MQEEEPEYENVTVSFVKPEGWAAVYAHVFAGEDGLVDWPGTALELADGVYSYTFSNKYTGIVFNNGLTEEALEQTVDIEYEAGKVYEVGEKNGEGKYTVKEYVPDDPEEWDGVVTLDLHGIGWFENDGARAYVYVWYTDGTNNDMPVADNAETHRANRVEAFVYTFKTDLTKTIQGIIVVRGAADGSAMWDQSVDLVDTANHVIVVTAMLV